MSDIDLDEFERRLAEDPDQIYEVSEFEQSQADNWDDNMSMASFSTHKQDKYFIAPQADLDLVVDQLVNKKTKHMARLQDIQNTYLDEVKQMQAVQMARVMTDDAQVQMKEFKQLNEAADKVEVEVTAVKLADEELIRQFEKEELERELQIEEEPD